MNYSDPKVLFSFKGRVNRQPYFFACLAVAIFLSLEKFVFSEGTASLALYILASYVYFAFAVRRAHDLDKNGWFTLVLFVPILNLWPGIELMFFKGHGGVNSFGEDPLKRSFVMPAQQGAAPDAPRR